MLGWMWKGKGTGIGNVRVAVEGKGAGIGNVRMAVEGKGDRDWEC